MMSTNPQLLAKAIKNRKNGFSGEWPRPTNPQSDAAKSAHNMSQFLQREIASPWPSLGSIKKSARSEWTIPSLKSRIAELKMEHRQQLSKVIRYQVVEEQKLCLEQYQSFEELEDWSVDVLEVINRLHRMERSLHGHQSDDFLSRLRYMHILALKPLYQKLHKLLLSEETAKTQRARLFPRSSQAWREMDTRDAKLKVAKFLLMDTKQQDEMISREPIWRDSQADDVSRVIREYRNDIVFSQEVNNFVKESQTTDPRRRAP